MKSTPAHSCAASTMGRTLTVTALAIGLLLAGAAAAQSGASPAKKPLLTREELRACMASAERLKTQRADLVQADTALTGEQAAIAREGDALKQAREALDLTNAEAVAAFNARQIERNRQIDDYNARAGALRARGETLVADEKAYREACAGREFDERDEIAIRRGK